MSLRPYLLKYWLLTRGLSLVLCITLAWTPFGIAWADALQAAGNSGQQTGQQIVGGFQFPMPGNNNTLILNPNTPQQSSINLNTLFPDAQNNNNPNLNNLYGDNPATMNAGLNAQTTLNTENIVAGDAYRTLINNAHQSHPDLQHDPLWRSGDQVFANYTPWAQSFSDCSSTTTQTTVNRPVPVPDYQLCLRQPTIPQYCTATHSVALEPLLRFAGGDGGFSSCGPGCMDLYIGQQGDNYWSGNCATFSSSASYTVLHPEAIISATLEEVDYDDYTRVFFAGNLLFTGSTGWGGTPCDKKTSFVDQPNQDVTYAFSSGGVKSFSQTTLVGGFGEGYARIRLRYNVARLITQDEWHWSGPNCQILANALTDHVCQAGSFLNCTTDPADASGCYVDPASQVMVCASDLSQAPVASSSGIRNSCLAIEASGPCDLNNIGECWTDTTGTHCLTPQASGSPTNTCKTLETQGCAFIKSQCLDSFASGTCWGSIDTYDCGQPVGVPEIQSHTQQQCAGTIRCMGEDCITVDRSQSRDYTKAVGLLNSAQQMSMDFTCQDANTSLQQQNPATCEVFKGKAANCKMVGGALNLVDCCKTPEGSMGLGRYIDLLLATSQLNNAVMRVDATSAVRGAWETMRTPFSVAGDAWNSLQADFASGVNNLVGSDLLSVSDVAEQGLLDSLKGELLKSVAEWIGSTFGEAAGNALFSAGGQAAFDSLGNLTPAAESGGVELGGGAAFAGEMLSTVMTAYTVVMIVVMIIQMIWSCELPEYELAAKKQLKVCKDLGTYCESKISSGLCLVRKESYCCFNSPLARILNEQIKPQLGMSFGTPENPECSGILVTDLDRINWNQVNLDEWLALLAETNHLPTAENAAAMLNLDQTTGSGSRLSPQRYNNTAPSRQNTLSRTQGRLNGLDVPSIKRETELEGWGMGPR